MSDSMHDLILQHQFLFAGVLVILCLLLFCCLLRAFKGPTVADRLVSVNMMGTMVMVIIGILTIMMNEGYLADIALIYAMLSFLAVILLTKVMIGIHKEESVSENGADDTKENGKENS